MDGDNVKIVQVPNSLDVEVAWHLQHPSHRSVNDSLLNENYAVKFGKLVPQDTGPDIVNGNVSMVDAVSLFLVLFVVCPYKAVKCVCAVDDLFDIFFVGLHFFFLNQHVIPTALNCNIDHLAIVPVNNFH